MSKKFILILIFTTTLIFVSCKINYKENYKEEAIKKCIELCEKAKEKIDLGRGPCLSDENPSWDLTDFSWVCDIARWPRQEIDNLPENQCKEYRLGKAKHFVELDPNCNFIRAY